MNKLIGLMLGLIVSLLIVDLYLVRKKVYVICDQELEPVFEVGELETVYEDGLWQKAALSYFDYEDFWPVQAEWMKKTDG